mgnify:CR=1 FL=1
MNRGFTLVEVLVVAGVIAVLYGLVSLRLINVSQIASVKNPVNQLVTDVKNQQTRAMATDTQGSGVVSDYGIYFETSRYTVFRGSSYSAVDPYNLVVNLPSRVQFSSITFPASTLQFGKGSGELPGFIGSQNTVTIRNIDSGEQKTVTVNRYGVVTGVN